MATQNQTAYNCRMSELYTVCEMGWTACKVKLANFTAFSPSYDIALISTRMTAIADAQNLPDFQARNSAAELARQALIAKNDEVLNAMQVLKRYITYSVLPQDLQSSLDAAGMSYYSEATNKNWDSSAQMLVSALNYVFTNNAALIANNNAPANFKADLDTLKSDFDALHSDFLTKRQDAIVATETKITANNQIYTDLIAMFADAKLLNFTAAEMKKFTFASLLQLISNTPSASLGGTVSDSATGNPIPNVTIEITNNGLTAVTGADGSYSFAQLAAGTYNLVCSAPGYQQWTGSVTLASGTSGIMNIHLVV